MSTVLNESPTWNLDGWTGNTTDSFGVQWIVTGESGWSDGAPIRLTSADRAGADGGISGLVLRGARLISLTGTAIAPNRIRMLLAKDALRAVAAGPGSYTLTVAEAHMTRQLQVKQFSELKISDAGSYAFRFELSLRADDPLRYGAEAQSVTLTLDGVDTSSLTFPITFPILTFGATSASTGVLVNTGNTGAYPVFQVSGPVSNPQLRNATTGEQMGVRTDLADGDVLTVDHQARHTTGAPLSALLPGSSWWALVPGANSITFAASSYGPGAQVTVTFRPAWK